MIARTIEPMPVHPSAAEETRYVLIACHSLKWAIAFVYMHGRAIKSGCTPVAWRANRKTWLDYVLNCCRWDTAPLQASDPCPKGLPWVIDDDMPDGSVSVDTASKEAA